MSKPVRIFTERLRVALTEKERASYARELSGQLETLERTEEEKKANAAHYTDEIKAVRFRMSTLSQCVNTGYDYRDVEVYQLADFESFAMVDVRADTGEEVRRRPMTEEERQRPLPMEDL